MDAVPPALASLCDRLKRTNLLASVLGVLQWDEQVNLPAASGERRAAQLALMAELHHQSATAPEIGALLAHLEAAPAPAGSDEATIVRHARRDYDRATRLPTAFVAEKAALDSEAYHVWTRARASSEFSRFAPYLQRQLDMARREAAYLGHTDRPYDYFLDRFDPGLNEAQVEVLFAELRAGLVPFVREIVASPVRAPEGVLRGFPVAEQDAFLREVTAALGFDYRRGRIDVAVHPFCSGDAADTRMTTRYSEDEPLDSLFSAIHETGHGLYEQGLPVEALGTALGEAVGMAIHESQSRLWENQVGRGRAFWRYFEPRLRARSSGRLEGIDSDALHLAINRVALTPIRTESDEVTYNLHIILRFEIERGLFAGRFAVADLPEVWRALSRELLDLEPESDARGVLQDVHWSGGAFGYFPSYCLGNMIAAQLWQAVCRAMPDLDEDFSRGDFSRLLEWLRAHVHRHGKRFDTRQLVRRVTGEELSPRHLLAYLRERYAPLYFPPKR